jgi:hypothetical protein
MGLSVVDTWLTFYWKALRMELRTITEYLVMQSHKGANGTYFDAWTLIHEPDILKAVQLAEEMIYNGELLGKVKSVKLRQFTVDKNVEVNSSSPYTTGLTA